LPSFQGRPGEKRTFKAFLPPRRQASRQRITELALDPIRRPTSLRERPEFNKAKAPLRRYSNNSALPFGLGIGVPLLNAYYSIIYAEVYSLNDRQVHDLVEYLKSL
jgi:hypothetical protein